MRKFKISFDDMNKYCELFTQMKSPSAGEYVPSEEELDSIIPRLDGALILFLLWIDETGIITDENKEMHKKIRDLLNECLIISYTPDAAVGCGGAYH